MTFLLISLNDNKLPAKHFMTTELATQISKSDLFLQKKAPITICNTFLYRSL